MYTYRVKGCIWKDEKGNLFTKGMNTEWGKRKCFMTECNVRMSQQSQCFERVGREDYQIARRLLRKHIKIFP